jgi:type I restriction enzyme M protein
VITPHEQLSQYVFPWLRELERTLQDTGNGTNGKNAVSPRLDDAYFQLSPEKTKTLEKAIHTIDELFKQVGQRGANYDILGDIFEYLLSEIETSGKNGQFRTPRHIIRFMIELLDPQPDKLSIDPAAGTGGFLIYSIQYMLKQKTDPQTLRLEWDGTPHHLTARILKSPTL